jgi:hypothetical protein
MASLQAAAAARGVAQDMLVVPKPAVYSGLFSNKVQEEIAQNPLPDAYYIKALAGAVMY